MSRHDPADYLDKAALPRLLDALVAQGWFVGERFIDTALCHSLQAELQTLKTQSQLDEAGIGRGQAHRIKRDVRGDAIHWLDRESRAQRQYLAVMTFLQQAINRALYLGFSSSRRTLPCTRPAPFTRSISTAFAAAATVSSRPCCTSIPRGRPRTAARWRCSTPMTPTVKLRAYAPNSGPSCVFSPTASPTRCCRPRLRAPASPAGSAATHRWAAPSIRPAEDAASPRFVEYARIGLDRSQLRPPDGQPLAQYEVRAGQLGSIEGLVITGYQRRLRDQRRTPHLPGA